MTFFFDGYSWVLSIFKRDETPIQEEVHEKCALSQKSRYDILE